MISCGYFLFIHLTGNRNAKNFNPIARRFTKLNSKEIIDGFAISEDPIDEIDPVFFFILKVCTRQ